jgi:hypothetical protein
MKLSKEFIAVFRKEAKKAQWEINSWNGKGIDDLVVDYLEHKELKPEDFTGAVILTVDEAKALLRRIPEFKESGDWQLPIERLKERIAKAEGK